jgi:hypothetical protein
MFEVELPAKVLESIQTGDRMSHKDRC